jgi:hypothetical protein
VRSLWVLIPLLLPLPAVAGPLKVGVEVRSTAGSWQPIAPADLSRAIENAALEELSRPGQLQLARAQKGTASDLLLVVEGRLLDEAQTYTVALTIGPGARADAPSLTAAETVVLEKLSRAQILEKVEGAARAAAKGLWGVLGPQLARLGDGTQVGPPPNLDADKTLPWQWGAVRIPKASVSSAGDLDSKDHQKRQAALRELTSLALSEALTTSRPRALRLGPQRSGDPAWLSRSAAPSVAQTRADPAGGDRGVPQRSRLPDPRRGDRADVVLHRRRSE